MPLTLATEPQYALPGIVQMRATPTTGNYVRIWCTAAPEGSELAKSIQRLGTGKRIEVDKQDAEGILEGKLEVGGAYTFVCQEYTKNASTHGGGYAGDPNGFQSEDKVGSEVTQTIYIGTKLACPLGSSTFGQAELVLWVWNDTVRATTVMAHDELTPAIVGPKTPRATTAARSATVATKLAALDGVLSAILVGNLDAMCADLRTQIPLHFNNASGVYHGVAAGPLPDDDNDTEIETLPSAPTTPAGLANFVSVVWRRLRNHMSNWDGSAQKSYHYKSSSVTPDYINVLAAGAPGESDALGTIMALGDLYRAYVAHIADATVHDAADTTNTMTQTLGLIPDLHQAFLDAQRTLSPTAPATQNPAVTRLVHGAGFREVPPAYLRG